MPDFRFEGSTLAGKAIQGVISAESLSDAKNKVKELSNKHRVKVDQILKRRTFLYKVRKQNGEVLKGEQTAFSKDEVDRAMKKLGYSVINIEPKLLDIKFKPPASDLVTFVRVSADLLREKLPYNEVLQLLVNDIDNPTLRNSVKEIDYDLRQGKDGEEAFAKQERIFGPFTAKILGMASKSGNMATIYENTAKFLERNAEFNKNLRSALITPLFTMLILMGAVIFYIAYIFPETAKLFQKMGSELPPMTTYTLMFSDFLVLNMWWISLSLLILTGGIFFYFNTPKGAYNRDRMLFSLPILGSLFHKTAIEIFCRVFHSLYSGSGQNIEAIRLAADACGNRYMSKQIQDVAIPITAHPGKRPGRRFRLCQGVYQNSYRALSVRSGDGNGEKICRTDCQLL